MAMRKIVQSFGRTGFRTLYGARTIPSHQQGPIAQETKTDKKTAHSEKDTYAPPQHRGAPDETHLQSWEKIKDDISQGRPGAQQSQQPWMEKAKETLTQAAGFIKEKTSNIKAEDVTKTAENLKEGAKEKLSQATDYLKSATDTTNKDLGEAAKEKLVDLKEGAKDKLAQAQEFVRKQTISDSTKKVKDSVKDKYEDLKFTAEQKKKITEEAWDFNKLQKGTTSSDTHTISGERTGKLKTSAETSGYGKEETNVAGQQTIDASSGKGILDSVKETAANAAEWMKDKLTPSGSEKPNVNAATDEKVHAASDKLKSDLKANEDIITKESTTKADKSFTDEKMNKKY